MRGLKILVIGMGVVIVLGTITLAALIVRRLSTAAPAEGAAISVGLGQPPGTRILGIAATQDRLAVHVGHEGSERVLLLDPRTGRVSGEVVTGSFAPNTNPGP